MQVVIQEEVTGCGIASVANIVNLLYASVKEKANSLGIYASDQALYSDTDYVRRLLLEYGVRTSAVETPFASWDALPNLALLSIKYHEKDGTPFWHWVVFKRSKGKSLVMDSAAYLHENARTDFENIQPKWFIEVINT